MLRRRPSPRRAAAPRAMRQRRRPCGATRGWARTQVGLLWGAACGAGCSSCLSSSMAVDCSASHNAGCADRSSRPLPSPPFPPPCRRAHRLPARQGPGAGGGGDAGEAQGMCVVRSCLGVLSAAASCPPASQPAQHASHHHRLAPYSRPPPNANRPSTRCARPPSRRSRWRSSTRTTTAPVRRSAGLWRVELGQASGLLRGHRRSCWRSCHALALDPDCLSCASPPPRPPARGDGAQGRHHPAVPQGRGGAADAAVPRDPVRARGGLERRPTVASSPAARARP